MKRISLNEIFDDTSLLSEGNFTGNRLDEKSHLIDDDEKIYYIMDIGDCAKFDDYKLLDKACENKKLDYSCKLYTSNMYWFLTGEKFPLKKLDLVNHSSDIFRTFLGSYTNGHGIIDEEIKQKLINRNRRFDFCAISSNVGARKSKKLFFKRIIEENLWDNGLISCPVYPKDITHVEGLDPQIFKDYIPAGIDMFWEEIPRTDWKTHYNFEFEKVTSIKGDKVLGKFHKAWMINGEIYRNSFVEVVLECQSIDLDIYNVEGIVEKFWRVSEKTIKALFTSPFIVVGSSYTLYYLKQLGFKTHSHIFDESYDEIINLTERVEFVIQELRKFCSLTRKEKQRKFEESMDIIEHNQKVGYDYTFNKGKTILPYL